MKTYDGMRWEAVPRKLRREVIDGIRRDGVLLDDWPDTRDHGRASNAAARFLDRCERANIVRVAQLIKGADGDPYDVVW